MKKLIVLFVFTFTLIFISCSDSSSSSDPSLQGKWAFGPVDTECNARNSIEFKNTNVFIEYHYNGNCSLTSYPGQYSKTGDIVLVNGTENIILELTNSTLVLYQTNNQNTKTYDKLN